MPAPARALASPEPAAPERPSQAPRPGGLPAGNIRTLDGLRGVAIGGVLACHFLNAWPGDGVWDRRLVAALGLGWTGVDLFFVLSGFLITGILVDTLQRDEQGRALPSWGWWSSFLVRRALRIFPLYYAALSVFGLAGPALGLVDPWTFGRWGWWYWSYLGNWAYPAHQVIPALSHFWSLAVEEQFYVVWPAVVLVAARRRLVPLGFTAGALVAAGPALRAAIATSGWPVGTAYRVTPGRLDALAAGALLAVLLRSESGRAAARRAWPWAALAGAAAFVALGAPRGFDMHDRALEIWSHTGLALAAGGLVAGAVLAEGTRGALARVLAAAPLRALGRYSYGLYVVHYPVHVGALRALRSTPAGAALLASRAGYATYVAGAALASLALAWVTWRAIERPFLLAKERLAPRTAGRVG
ncbi:acyltransferase family protein [Anaeromyxobacter oryzae]|uniref:Acyltransferase n=1 Tax=Anaeromyxobacter oryzae TaxID=2918170 RepID=A0ABM7WNL6_9BACT|nr:acyltransferase [Anaeromyxobacter oryzae]BDG01056.1 acyltransferase [Anaeromyxobacter oryzae]